jgi:Phage-related protein
MHKIVFYKDKNDIEPVKEYILSLVARSDKDSRIKLNKIQDYVQILAQYGTRAGEPYIKHLDGEIWELRPLRDRILFFCWVDDTFVLLHHFVKKAQKTPKREIERAIKNMIDFIEGSDDDGQE